MEKIDTRDKNYDWLLFPKAYFYSVIICCKWLEKRLTDFLHNTEVVNSDETFKFYSPEYLIFPIIYNLKHALELYLKALSRLCNGSYLGKEHNMEKLLQDLENKNKNIKLSDKLKNIIKKYHEGKYVPFSAPGNTIKDTKNKAERYPEHFAYFIPEFFEFDKNKSNVKSWVNQKLIKEIEGDAKKSFEELGKIQKILLSQNNRR